MRDEWTALQFDKAVMTFGVWIENKLAEKDERGHSKYTLRELLDIPLTETEIREQNQRSYELLKKIAGL